jgi:hypothetical protein
MNTTDNYNDDLRQRLTDIFSQNNDELKGGCGCGGGCGCHTSEETEMEACNCDGDCNEDTCCRN